MRSIALLPALLSLVLAAQVVNACSVPERDFKYGAEVGEGSEGGEGGLTKQEATGGSSAENGPDGSGGQPAEHPPGTPLKPAVPDGLKQALIWNAPVEETLFLKEAASGVIWAVVEGSLPSGLNLDSDGTLSGRAQELGSFTFVVRAISPTDDTGELEITLAVESRSWIAYLILDNDTGMEHLSLADLAVTPEARHELESAPESGRFGSLSFSPDGRSFAYLVDEDGDPSDCVVKLVHLKTVGSPSAQTVGSAKSTCNEPFRWSPDGSAFVHLRLTNGNAKAPVLVRARDGDESYFILTNKASEDAVGIDWVSDTLVLFNQSPSSPDLALDVTEASLENPRALSDAPSTSLISPSEQRFIGTVDDSFEVIDIDDDFTATVPDASRIISPGVHYSLLEQAGPVFDVHELRAFESSAPDPVVSIERDYHQAGDDKFVYFSGPRDRYLNGFFFTEGDLPALWEVDLEDPTEVRDVDVPATCTLEQLSPGSPLYCTATEGGFVQTYLYRPGIDRSVDPTLDEETFGASLIAPVLAPHDFGLLHILSTDMSGAGVYWSEHPPTGTKSLSQAISPVDDATATSVVVDLTPTWTADGVFAVFVMDRAVATSVASSAVWAYKTLDPDSAVNVSASNNSCQSSASSWAGDDCLRVSRLVAQPVL